MDKANNPSAVHLQFAIVWNRLTFSRLTIIYVCFSFLHFVVQITLQSKALSINMHALNVLMGKVTNQTLLDQGLPIMQGSTLKICTWVPYNLQTDISACKIIWDTANSNPATNVSNSSDDFESVYFGEPTISTTSIAAPPTTTNSFNATLSATSSVTLSTMTTTQTPSATSHTTTSTPRATSTTVQSSTTTIPTSSIVPSAATLFVHSVTSFSLSPSPSLLADSGRIPPPGKESSSNQNVARQLQYTADLKTRAIVNDLCQTSLIWPISNLRSSEREDIVFMAFQCWVLGVSVVALLNESIPHTCASLVTHMMASGWAAFQISATESFRSRFDQVIENGTCKGMVALSGYWGARYKAEMAILMLNIVALVISSYLTWRIIKLFGWQTFKRVGASLLINRIYRLVLLLSTVIQLSLFFIATTVSLWIDRLVNGSIGDQATFRALYLVSSGITLTLLLPWLATGWFGIRRELRLPTFFFLLLSLLYLSGWGVMFFSHTFLWTFVTWRFFSVMASASVFLVCVTFILGVICRYNFGKGLRRHFIASSQEPDSPIDVEKPQFLNCETLPTFPQIGASSPRARIDASTNAGTVVIPVLPYHSNSLAHSYLEYEHKEDSSDTHSNATAGLSHSSSLSSTRSGGCQAKRWVIE